MKAMSTVVLRKDLSLSRRLYTWLLGSSEDPTQQIEHFASHGLDLLQHSLLEDIHTSSNNESSDPTSTQRALRVIISLMDKWEISSPLLNAMCLHLFRELEILLSRPDISIEVGSVHSRDLNVLITPVATNYNQHACGLSGSLHYVEEHTQCSSTAALGAFRGYEGR